MKDLAANVDGADLQTVRLAPSLLRSIANATADVTLLIDESGIIREASLGHSEEPIVDAMSWVGRPWVETVTPESRTRILELLRDTGDRPDGLRRQVDHISEAGSEIPIVYATLRLGNERGPFVALGRDLRDIAQLRRQLVDAQQRIEREHWEMRRRESRYRLLHQVSSEAILFVDPATQKVIDANPAAGELFGCPARKLLGRRFPLEVDDDSEGPIQDLLAAVRSQGQGDEVQVRLRESGRNVKISIFLARQDEASVFLVQLRSQDQEEQARGGRSTRVIDSGPDGFVRTDGDGRVLAANRAFLELVELQTESQARGQPLARWIGRPGADVPMLLAALREHRILRLFMTSLRGELGTTTEIEISGVAAPDGPGRVEELIVRDVGRRLLSGPTGARDLTRAVEQLGTLIGRVSLKNLLRETADLVERHFIEGALAMTGDNRTSAAEVLGLSRQSLYVKLRRHNLGHDHAEKSEARVTRPRGRKRKR